MAVRMSGMVSNLDTESIMEALMSAQKAKKTKIENKITKLEWKQETWKELNKKIYSFYTESLSKMRLQSTYNTKKASSSDESIASVTAASTAPAGTHTLQVTSLASSQFVTGDQLTTDKNSKAITASTTLLDMGMASGETNVINVTTGGKTKSLTIEDDTTIGEFLDTLKGAGLNASYDTTQKRFFVSSKESGSGNAFSITTSGSVDLTKLGLSEIVATESDGEVTIESGTNVKVVAPSDASIIYNGATLKSSSNSITVNGLSINLKNTTETGKTISFSVTNDTQAVYDTIKSFVKSYNELLQEMNDAYYAETAKGYDPLTEEEKEAMSEDQIEKWETKIKDSLLRRDDTLGSLISTMRTSLGGSVSVDSDKYTLSSFGIGTSSSYLEKGKLHIDGDADDSTTSAKEDKLMKALTEDPDAVMETFTELASSFYKSMSKSMTSTSLRSALTVYNDKGMTKQLTNYKEDLDDMEDYLEDMENRYYKQFTAMETALSKLNSQSSSIMSMLGTGS